MNRYFGNIGYGEALEKPIGSGKWVDNIVEYQYYGDILRNTRNLEPTGETLNDNISVGNSISIVADQYAVQNFMSIRYIWWNSVAWKVTNVEVRSPRLVLSLGSVYNGPFPEAI